MFSKLAAPWGWGIGGDLELHCEVVIILAGGCSKTEQVQNHQVFHSVFCTSMASVSLQIRDMVTTQPPGGGGRGGGVFVDSCISDDN